MLLRRSSHLAQAAFPTSPLSSSSPLPPPSNVSTSLHTSPPHQPDLTQEPQPQPQAPQPHPSFPSSPSPTSSSPTPTPPHHQSHHDLSSFLSYAARVALPQTSTLFIGTHYEYTVLAALARLHLRLTRVGGRSDAGIDLLGRWALPEPILSRPLRVLVQCKALQRTPAPYLVRELEGAFAGVPAGWRATAAAGGHGGGDDPAGEERPGEQSRAHLAVPGEAERESRVAAGMLGLLATPKPATKGVREAMGRSRLPLGFAMIGLDGRITQLLWNWAARELWLEGVGVTTRYCPPSEGLKEGDGVEEGVEDKEKRRVRDEVVLTWKGEVLPDG